jgi:hypothetical protein
MLRVRIPDPVPIGPWIRNGFKSGYGSGMNNPDHISESLEAIFYVKIFKFFDEDPFSGMGKFFF